MKLTNIKRKLSQLFNSQLFWLQVCAIGIWLLVIQNYFGREEGAQSVYVVGGNIDADVNNTVDVNVEAVNGYRNAFYGPSADGSYDAIHVYTGK
jgi:hypothetical protein